MRKDPTLPVRENSIISQPTRSTIGAAPPPAKLQWGWRGAFDSRAVILWLIAGAAIATTAVGLMQVSHRAPLVWDEAVRLDPGSQLADAIRAFDLGGVWQWINSQVFYPFLDSAPNGLVLMISGNSQVAAWLPALIAYGLSGVLAGRLAGTLGAGPIGAMSAGVLCWTTPIAARLAAGAFTEPIGACLILLVLLGLVNLDYHRGLAFPALIGVLIATMWFVKYDYGLLALGTAGLTALLTLATRGTWERLRAFVALIGTAVILIATWFSVNFAEKLQGASAFVGPHVPGSSGGIDLTYYVRALVLEAEVGFAPLIAVLFLLGIVAVVTSPRRPLTDAPLICLALWFVMYSTATIKYPRYLGFITPLLAAFAGLLVGRLVAWLRRAKWTAVTRGSLALATAVTIWQLVLQTAGPAGPRTQFWFLAPNPEASQALSFISNEADCKAGQLLFLGQSNELSPAAVHLAWSERLGHQAPSVQVVPEAAPALRAAAFRAALRPACRVVGVDIKTGARLDTLDVHTNFASQADYLRIATSLESNGLLRRLRTTSTTDGLVQVTIWAPT